VKSNDDLEEAHMARRSSIGHKRLLKAWKVKWKSLT